MKTIKILLLLLAVCSLNRAYAQSFVSPIGFVKTEVNTRKVVAYIEQEVKESYSKLGMNDPLTLRMMEEENLACFKKLIRITNTDLLQNVINTYCEIGMCNYSMILIMYEEQSKASKKTLKW